jgi:hypothetical protein
MVQFIMELGLRMVFVKEKVLRSGQTVVSTLATGIMIRLMVEAD